MKSFIDDLISAGIEENEAKKEISILESEIKDKETIKKIVNERVKTRTPIQYLLGKAFFMDFEVKVNPKVLIPRPETEILVEETVKRLAALYKDCVIPAKAGIQERDLTLKLSGFPVKPGMTITALDIGTGSGIIAIALAKLIPDIKIMAIDINKEIIDLAKENAKLNNVENKINFKVCDIFSKCFEGLLQSRRFDLIVCNPPYVKGGACHGKPVQPEVVHEPRIALYGSKENKTGLVYYERIVELFRRGLINQTRAVKLLAFEIDPPLVGDLKKMLKKNNLNNYEIVKDYAKLERCLFVCP